MHDNRVTSILIIVCSYCFVKLNGGEFDFVADMPFLLELIPQPTNGKQKSIISLKKLYLGRNKNIRRLAGGLSTEVVSLDSDTTSVKKSSNTF